MIEWQEIFRMKFFRFQYFFIFCDHGIKSGLRPMLNCIFHTAISCWYAVSCIPKWTPYFLKNDSVTRIWFLIRLNLFRWIPYSSLLTLIWPCLTSNNLIMTKPSLLNQFVWCPWNIFGELSDLCVILFSFQSDKWLFTIDLIWPSMTHQVRVTQRFWKYYQSRAFKIT